jgi:hypothetical protein
MFDQCLTNARRVWQAVRRSVLHSLWSSPAGNVVEQQLSLPCNMSQSHNSSRGQRLQLYARALNDSFVEVRRCCLCCLGCGRVLCAGDFVRPYELIMSAILSPSLSDVRQACTAGCWCVSLECSSSACTPHAPPVSLSTDQLEQYITGCGMHISKRARDMAADLIGAMKQAQVRHRLAKQTQLHAWACK